MREGGGRGEKGEKRGRKRERERGERERGEGREGERGTEREGEKEREWEKELLKKKKSSKKELLDTGLLGGGAGKVQNVQKKLEKLIFKENRWSSFWRRACWEVEKESTKC